jgi:hypothetical protein
MSIASEEGVKAFLDGFPKQPRKIIDKPNYQDLHKLMNDIKEMRRQYRTKSTSRHLNT